MIPAQLSLCQLGMNDEGPIALIEAASEAGFRAVGLPLRSGALRPMRNEIVGHKDVIRDIRAACLATGVGIFDVESLVLGHEPAHDDLLATFETAAELGASRISCLGYEPLRGPGTILVGGEAERFAQLADAAAQFGLIICIEFMAFRSISSLGVAAQILLDTGVQNGGIVLDALHFQRTGATLKEVAALPPGVVSHLQICDASAKVPPIECLAEEARSSRLLPGDGVIPLHELINALPKGTLLALEIPTRALADLSVAERAKCGAASIASL